MLAPSSLEEHGGLAVVVQVGADGAFDASDPGDQDLFTDREEDFLEVLLEGAAIGGPSRRGGRQRTPPERH